MLECEPGFEGFKKLCGYSAFEGGGCGVSTALVEREWRVRGINVGE